MFNVYLGTRYEQIDIILYTNAKEMRRFSRFMHNAKCELLKNDMNLKNLKRPFFVKKHKHEFWALYGNAFFCQENFVWNGQKMNARNLVSCVY